MAIEKTIGKKLLRIALILALFSITSISLSFCAGLLKDIRIQGNDLSREIILSVEGSYYYKYFELNDPERLVIDLFNVKIKDSYEKEIDSSYLEKIRAAQFQMEPQIIARVVFDLNSKTPYRVSYKEGNLSVIFSENDIHLPDTTSYYTRTEETQNLQHSQTGHDSGSSINPNLINSEELVSSEGEVILETRKVPKSLEPTRFFNEGDYKIGSEDLLEIKVFDIPQFNHTVRVSENGTISLPLIGIVQTNDLTKRQLENKIADLLSKFVHNPQLNIFIKEAESKKISVSGAVKKPGIYEMLSRQRLLDMISKAGGFTNEIGKELFVYRNDESGNRIRIPIDIERVLYYGEPDLNIEIKPGDVIFVPLEIFFKIYVNGAVKSPGSFDIKKSESITVHQAITMAGSTTDRAAEHKTQILRRLPEGKSEIIKVNLKKIKKGKAEDILLKNGDIVYVPEAFF